MRTREEILKEANKLKKKNDELYERFLKAQEMEDSFEQAKEMEEIHTLLLPVATRMQEIADEVSSYNEMAENFDIISPGKYRIFQY